MWPYKADQRVEFINRDDVADALFACAYATGAKGKILNISGGKSWQMSGREYVTALYSEAMELEPQKGGILRHCGLVRLVRDTEESQALLKYQNTPFSGWSRAAARMPPRRF